MSTGRGFLDFNGPGEQAAFGAWMKEQIDRMGGRKHVTEASGISHDMLSAYVHSRSIPSRKTLVRMIDFGLIQYATPEDLAAHTPWLEPKYLKASKKAAVAKKPDAPQPAEPAANREIPVPPVPVNLLDAILAEPNLSAKQRVQLTAMVTLVLSDVDVQVSVSPR